MNSLLRDKNMLYIVFASSLLLLVHYLIISNYNAILFFCTTGLLATYFSKNMIIVLLSAILSTFIFSLLVSKRVEGFDEKEVKKNDNKKENNNNNDVDESDHKESDKDSSSAPKIDYAQTLEEAYDNLDKMIGSDGVNNMTTDTTRLAKKQKELMANIEKMGPLFEKATNMLSSINLDGVSSLQNSLGETMNKLGGLGVNKLKK
jgi:predicted membrane protein